MWSGHHPYRLIALLTLVAVLVVLAIGVTNRRVSRRPQGGDCREVDGRREVFVKTFDAPEGKWAEVVDADKTAVVMFWFITGDRYLVYHKDGKLTYADGREIQEIVRRAGE
jgi:hypothetical protein